MGDVLEHIRRRLRPYELVAGQTEEIFQDSVARIAAALRKSIRAAVKEFDAAIDNFAAMPADLRQRRPRVFVIGEFLLNFHAGSNNYIEKYLEDHGMEVVLPDAFAPMHRDYMKKDAEARLFYVKYPFLDMFANNVTIGLIDQTKRAMLKRIKRLPFMELPISLRELATVGDEVVHHTFTPGEGWLIAAEILHNADAGIENFVILQPFGCLPNHIVGRGLVKKIKELRPGIQILPLDFDPDTSVANIENRLQMLIINAREAAAADRSVPEVHG
jgi:predicted nucleotide-binding protein (sugar kinase/HSP70/actin superfamily)